MYNVELENDLLLPDIADRLTDYVSIQLNIDEARIKAACLLAQRLDVVKTIGKVSWERCFEDNEDYSEELFDLIVPTLCFYTYARCLKLFQGNFTDSGYTVEEAAEAVTAAKAASHEHKSVADDFMNDVIEWLEEENPQVEIEQENLVKRVRTFGGKEKRASN